MAEPIQPMRTLLVTGSRSITDRAWCFRQLDKYFNSCAPATQPAGLIHGGALGADTLAGEWALGKEMQITIVRPDFKRWPVSRHRWRAYGERDRAMVTAADDVIALWDGKSSGTRLTKDFAAEQGKLRAIYFYDGEESLDNVLYE
jgi:hypothetical protein